MIEIIPNWHPLLVHFTVALLATSSLLFVLGTIAPATAGWKQSCLTVARWNLWLGALITFGTVAAGLQAYNTVTHDAPSHAAMTDHKNWALPTAGFFILLAVWSFMQRKAAKVSALFLVLLIAGSGLLATTGFKGGEAVYRYGLGVMSLPQVSGDGGHGSHTHGEGAGHGGGEEESGHHHVHEMDQGAMPEMSEHDKTPHGH